MGAISKIKILFLAGVTFVVGLEHGFSFFFQQHKWKGSGAFFGGILTILLGFPVTGICLEVYGLVVIFSGLFPVSITFLRWMPVIGKIFNLHSLSEVSKMSRQLILNFEPSSSILNKAPHLFTSSGLDMNRNNHSGLLGELKYSLFYETMSNWQLSECEMKELNIPEQHPSDSNRAEIPQPYHKFFHYISKPNKRKCARCKKMYNVHNPRKPCKYHWKGYYHDLGVNICCNRPKGGEYCATSPRCVNDAVDKENLFGYKNTSVDGHGGPDVFALDAEMAYTHDRLEACALTLVDANCQIVYETCFLPDEPIIDYNTRHSHLTEKDFCHTSTTLADVQQQLLQFIGPSTILVGHSLRCDLLYLKLIHNKIVDTSVLFPAKEGKTRSLQGLKKEYLEEKPETNYKLKCTDDAITTMRLVLLKASLHEKGYSNIL